MPKQETFLEESADGVAVEVLKTYDRSYAREVFGSIGDDARKALEAALDIGANYEPADIRIPTEPNTTTSFGRSSSRPLAKMCDRIQICIRSSWSARPGRGRPRTCTYRRIGPAPRPSQRSCSRARSDRTRSARGKHDSGVPATLQMEPDSFGMGQGTPCAATIRIPLGRRPRSSYRPRANAWRNN